MFAFCARWERHESVEFENRLVGLFAACCDQDQYVRFMIFDRDLHHDLSPS